METADSSEIVTCMNAQCGQQLRIPAGEILQVTCPTCGTSFTYRPPRPEGGSKKGLSPESQRKAWVMGELMLMIARESMTLLKRNSPDIVSKIHEDYVAALAGCPSLGKFIWVDELPASAAATEVPVVN